MKSVMNSIKMCVTLAAIVVFGVQCGGDKSNTPAFSTPVLSSPANAETGVSTEPTLSWNTVGSATSYHLEISTNSTFSTLVYDDSTIQSSSTALSTGLNAATAYYWRVQAKNATGTTSWSTVWSFTSFSGPLELLYPQGGSGVQFHVGDVITIKWTIHNLDVITDVELRYSLDSGVTWPSTQVINKIGGASFSYPDTTRVLTIDSTLVSKKFRFRVNRYNDQTLNDKSAAFTITR
jgi:hypothetical protein